MTDVLAAELQSDRLSHWVMVKREALDSCLSYVSDRLMTRCKKELYMHGYMADPNRSAEIVTTDRSADFFCNNDVIVIAEYPVLLTRKQWLERHIPPLERNLELAWKCFVEAQNDEARTDAQQDIDHYRACVRHYKEELASL